MLGSSLVELFKTLTAKEVKEFALFLGNPYFDRGKYRKEVKIIFELLAKHAPDGWERADLTKEKVYKKIFPTAAFVEGRLEKVMVECSKSLRNFLLAQRYFGEKNWQNAQADYAEELRDRRLLERAEQTTQVLLHDLAEEKAKDIETYARLHRVSALLHGIKSHKNTWREDLNIGQTLHYLDLYHFANRLRLLNHYLVLNGISKIDSNIDIEKERYLCSFWKIEQKEHPSIYILKNIFELYTTKEISVAAVEDLLNLLNEYEKNISDLDIKNYFAFVRNLCSHLMRTTGNAKAAFLSYRVLRDNLAKGYLYYYGNQIPPGTMLNMCGLACRFEDFDWVYDFINSHKHNIMGNDEQLSYYHVCISYYFFYIKKFQDSLDHIPQNVVNKDYYVASRCLEVMNYYELKSDLLQPKLDAFKMYLSRGQVKHLSEKIYTSHNNLVNLLYQIIQSKPGDPKRKELLLERIQEKPQLAFRDWLIAKVKELK